MQIYSLFSTALAIIIEIWQFMNFSQPIVHCVQCSIAVVVLLQRGLYCRGCSSWLLTAGWPGTTDNSAGDNIPNPEIVARSSTILTFYQPKTIREQSSLLLIFEVMLAASSSYMYYSAPEFVLVLCYAYYNSTHIHSYIYLSIFARFVSKLYETAASISK